MNLIIRTITRDNFWEIINLKVNEDQFDYIEDNGRSIAESKYFDYWKPVGLYDDDLLIGFAMYGEVEGENRVWLDRYMIDKKFQNKGYGQKFLTILIDYIREIYNCNELYLSIFEENKNALRLYLKNGFNFNGEFDYGGEKVMMKTL